MPRVTVGHLDPCVHPLWLSRLNMRLARLMGASAVWVPDHFMSFTPASAWTPATTWRAHGVAHPLGEDHRGFLDLVPTRIADADVDRAAATMTPALLESIVWAGSAREIRDQVAPLAAAGCRHFIVAHAGATFTGDGVRSLGRLAKLIRRLRRL